MKAMPADRPRVAVTGHAAGWGRFVGAYALDLSISVVVLLATVRTWQVIAGAPRSNALADSLEGAVARLTPFGLWDIYHDQLRAAVLESAAQAGTAALSNMLFGFRLLYDGLLAVPDTVGVVWQQTSTPADWITLLGFLGILLMSFLLLISKGRLTLVRLLLALAGSPLAALALFWLAQQTALDALNGFACYAQVAPWCLLCPVLCTVYWVVSPGAEHSATVTGLRALARLRLPQRERRGIADGVSTIPRTRR